MPTWPGMSDQILHSDQTGESKKLWVRCATTLGAGFRGPEIFGDCPTYDTVCLGRLNNAC